MLVPNCVIVTPVGLMCLSHRQTLQTVLDNMRKNIDADSEFSLQTHTFGPQALTAVLSHVICKLDQVWKPDLSQCSS